MPEDRGRPYDAEETAALVAAHGFWERVYQEDRFSGRDDEKYGPELNIVSEQDFAAHIKETIENPYSYAFHGAGNRDVYYNPVSNTVVIVNQDDPERSTAWRSDNGRDELDRLERQENRSFAKAGLDERVEIHQGGIDALYPLEKQEQVEAEPTAEQKTFPHTPVPPSPEPEIPQPVTDSPPQESWAAANSSPSSYNDIVNTAGEAFEEVIGGLFTEVASLFGGGSTAQAVEGGYFAKCVEDPEKYPPRDDEMAARLAERQSMEKGWEIARVRAGGTAELSEDERRHMINDRAEWYMERGFSHSM